MNNMRADQWAEDLGSRRRRDPWAGQLGRAVQRFRRSQGEVHIQVVHPCCRRARERDWN